MHRCYKYNILNTKRAPRNEMLFKCSKSPTGASTMHVLGKYYVSTI